MLQKSARIALSVLLLMALCPLSAWAAEGDDASQFNLFEFLFGQAETQAAPSNLYEYTLPDPRSTDVSLEPSGILLGAGGALYYLPETTRSDASGDSTFGYRPLYRFDIPTSTWQQLADVPEWLSYGSAVVWNGNILLIGAATVSGGLVEHAFLFNTASSTWSQASSLGVPLAAGIADQSGYLRVIGGMTDDQSALLSGIYSYDPYVGIGSQVATLTIPVMVPQAVSYGGSLYVYSFGNSPSQWNGFEGNAHFQVVTQGVATNRDGALPAQLAQDVRDFPSARALRYGSITAATDGVMLVGPQAANGSADTYILAWGTTSFAQFSKRASATQLSGVAACDYLSRLYVIGTTDGDANGQLFRSTVMAGPEVTSGNYAVWRRGSEQPLPFGFSPEYVRFTGRVTVDGVSLREGSQFISTSGNTNVYLLPSYLSTLDLGRHTLEVFFDENYASARAYFTVEVPATPVNELPGDVTRPAALARTADDAPVAPFAAGGIASLAVAAYALRRKSSDA